MEKYICIIYTNKICIIPALKELMIWYGDIPMHRYYQWNMVTAVIELREKTPRRASDPE